MHSCSRSLRHCCNFSRIIRKCAMGFRQELPPSEYLRNLVFKKLKLETDNYKALWATSVKEFSSHSFKITLIPASCSGLQKNGFVWDTSQATKLGHLTIPCHNNQGGILSFVKWYLWSIWDFCLILLRILQLTLIFIPLLVLYPVTKFGSQSKMLWYRLLLFDLEFSGPIFVKLGQWASTRRDLFPEDLCQCLSKLQRKTRAHSWFYTKKCLEKAFGSKWKDIFVHFDNDYSPVGSGCCAQVYKVWIDPAALDAQKGEVQCYDCSEDSLFVEGMEMLGLGSLLGSREGDCGNTPSQTTDLMPVAMKVRHPRMEIMLRRDLLILKSMASTVTWIFPSLKWLSLVDCVEEFAQLMKAQVDLCVEANNLDKFSANFKGVTSVKFPQPVWPLTRSYLLVETYEEGQPMLNYVTDKVAKRRINVKLAELGVNTILKMVFLDNFAHGDLHPGNMLVQERDYNVVEKERQKIIFPFGRVSKPSNTFPVNLVILDCGITASLDDRGKKCLRGVFSAVADGDGERAGELFLQHSNHQCEDPESFKSRMKEIVSTAINKSVTLEQIEVSSLLSSLFSAMIDHKVKLDGSFSSVILAIMVLEGLGRSLDPTIDLIEKARPFLLSAM